MSRDADRRRRADDSADASPPTAPDPGKRSRTGDLPVQRRAADSGSPAPNETGMPDGLKFHLEHVLQRDLSPVRVHADSPEPAGLGAQAYTRGADVHFAPGAYDPGSAAGQALIGHEMAHVVQQSDGQTTANARARGMPVDTSDHHEHAATAAASQPAAPSSGPLPPVRPPSGEQAVAQMWPPNSVQEATAEIEQLEARLLNHGIRFKHEKYGREHTITIDGLSKKDLATIDWVELAPTGFDPGRSGLGSADEACQALQQLVRLRRWRTSAERDGGGFGYSSVSSSLAPPMSPLQDTFGFTALAPNLHGRPLDQPGPGRTGEKLDNDWVVRDMPSDELDEMRSSSRGYRTPGRGRGQPPPIRFGPDVYQDSSTVLDQRRAEQWAGEKRNSTAHRGPFSGDNWPGQKSIMKMSAQEAARLYNQRGHGPPLDLSHPYDWLHLYAFSIGGQDAYNPQQSQNLVLGTSHANFYHQIFESAAKKIARGFNVRLLVRAEPIGPVDPELHVYRAIRYSISVIEVIDISTFENPNETVTITKRTLTRLVDCMATTPVHSGDAKSFCDEVAHELGFITPRYQQAVDDLFPSNNNGPNSGSGGSGFGGGGGSNSNWSGGSNSNWSGGGFGGGGNNNNNNSDEEMSGGESEEMDLDDSRGN